MKSVPNLFQVQLVYDLFSFGRICNASCPCREFNVQLKLDQVCVSFSFRSSLANLALKSPVRPDKCQPAQVGLSVISSEGI